jgi:hypothetical protein
MRKSRALPEGSTEILREAMKAARTKGQYQQVLCLWLRAIFHLNSEQTALATGLTPRGVRAIWMRFRHEGPAMFKRPGKGGRHRENLSRAEERAFLDRLLVETQPANAVMSTLFIQEAYEKALGRAVSYSVVRRLLKRHDWRPIDLGHVATPQRWAAAELPARYQPRPKPGATQS